MTGSYPVGIRQVDAYRTRRIFLSSEHNGLHDCCRYAFHFGLLEAWVNGTVLLKPLCVAADGSRALCCHLVFQFHNALPRGLETQRIVVDFYKSIHKIYIAIEFLHPLYAIAV